MSRLVTDDSNFRYLNSHVDVNLLKVKKGHNFRFMGHYIYLCYQFLKIGKMKITKKKIAWGIVLLILIAGGVICKIRWKVWFHNIPEIRYVLTEDPQRVFLTFGNDGELSRNVSWVCGRRFQAGKVGIYKDRFRRYSSR